MTEHNYGRIWDLLVQAAENRGDKEALCLSDEKISYNDLLKRVTHVASGLLNVGISKGDKVAVLCPNILAWPLTELACNIIGAVCVPINMLYRITELEHTLRFADVNAIVMVDRFATADFLSMIIQICPELHEIENHERLSISKLPSLRNIITLTHPPNPGMLSFKELETDYGADALDDSKLENAVTRVTEEDVALLQFTSGTTAFPKGVLLSQSGIIGNPFMHFRRLGIDEADRVMSVMPFYHVGGSALSLLGALTTGSTLFMTEKFDVLETMRIIDSERCSAIIGLETMFLMMMAHPDYHNYDLTCLKKGSCAGSYEVLQKISRTMKINGLCNVYGLSEACSVAVGDVRDTLENRCYFSGKPIPGLEISIRDPKSRKPLDHNETGEIAVRGFSVMRGYYKNQEETERVIDKEGWYHTGDLGILNEEGYLRFMGRIKETLRVGGENVSALEVEKFLISHPKVLKAAVIGVPDDRLIEVAMAFIELNPGEILYEDEIIAYCKGKIAPFKVPRYVRFVDDFPMTGSGKIQKYLLKEKVLKEFSRSNSNEI